MGIVERGEHLRFALEPGHALRVFGESLGQNFQRHLAPQLRITRAIHFAHPARPQRREDFVRPEFGSRHRAHFFFNNSVQLVTRVIGSTLVCAGEVINTNFFPSGATS